jgi:hypothetical protein
MERGILRARQGIVCRDTRRGGRGMDQAAQRPYDSSFGVSWVTLLVLWVTTVETFVEVARV